MHSQSKESKYGLIQGHIIYETNTSEMEYFYMVTNYLA